MGFELLVFIGIFALVLGVIGTFMGWEDNEKRRMRADHEARRYGPNPWDPHRDDRVVRSSGTPVR